MTVGANLNAGEHVAATDWEHETTHLLSYLVLLSAAPTCFVSVFTCCSAGEFNVVDTHHQELAFPSLGRLI